jgi:hypothetical protein
MRHPKFFQALLISASTLVPMVTIGCAGEVRVYDPDHRDYHRWNRDEIVFYTRWETNTHRDHREWRERRAEEQQEYWAWRHSH